MKHYYISTLYYYHYYIIIIDPCVVCGIHLGSPEEMNYLSFTIFPSMT